MTAIILAGGKATRMKGRDKAFLKINNEPFIERQIRLLKKIFKKIIIVTNSSERYRVVRGVTIVCDIIPHLGPLGGIYSGLTASSSFCNFVVACDMPFLDTGFIEHMHREYYGYDAVVPRINGKYEPLFAFYSKRCRIVIRQLLDEKIFKMSELCSRIRVREITEEEIRHCAVGEKMFTNINTEKDFAYVYAG
ncbi:MAG: molybdenum cofactor guanylyltransferase [Candidatus Omnitrophota bacterium]|nr:molybdenum cofactor guanylyltransferase [Candidatus Omnitrophota bacterium]